MTTEQRLEEARIRGLSALKAVFNYQQKELERLGQCIKQYEHTTSDRLKYTILSQTHTNLNEEARPFIERLAYSAMRLHLAWEVDQDEKDRQIQK